MRVSDRAETKSILISAPDNHMGTQIYFEKKNPPPILIFHLIN